ncbi:MAG: penicillin-binding protein 2 [Elusimicrobia bacterium]|nr:penicillin-binding protein 2 [Elusimicrobiota bacterium]
MFLIIIVRLLSLQIINYSNINKYSNNIVHKQATEKQKRGLILDRNGNILAMSIKKYSLYLDAKMLQDVAKTEKILNGFDVFFEPRHYEQIKQKKSYIPIKQNIDERTALEIIAKNIPGVGLESSYTRLYPEQRLAAHVIGKTDSKEKGTYGIEKFCDSQLTGENIKRQQYTVGNKKVFSDYLEDKNYNASNDVRLTIDRKLQFIAEEELKEGVKRTKSKKAIAIIQNPNNGDILAMVSLPNYNPNEPVKKLEYLNNAAISDINEPGSTFKLIILSAVLEEGICKLSDRIDCEGGKFKYAGRVIRDDHGKAKYLTVKQIMEQSSNVGTAKLALKLGEDKFYEYIRLFGFNSQTGIELTGEAKGMLRPIERWTKGSLPTLSFGQELSVTAIQTLSAYSAIANGGTLLKPRIIKSIGDKEYNSREPVRRVVSEETALKVRGVLEAVVKDGTGKSAKIAGYSVGGKTGTAQKYDKTIKSYSKKHYMASFCGMIPAKKPELVILVIFDEPDEKNYYAASVAAPVFAKIAERAVEYLKIPCDEQVKPIVAKNKKEKEYVSKQAA